MNTQDDTKSIAAMAVFDNDDKHNVRPLRLTHLENHLCVDDDHAAMVRRIVESPITAMYHKLADEYGEDEAVNRMFEVMACLSSELITIRDEVKKHVATNSIEVPNGDLDHGYQ